jgi:hypothetical protein
MRLYNVDLHISVIRDLQDIFAELGHTIDSDSLSGHTWVMEIPKASIPLLEANINQIVEKELWKDFHREYKGKLKEYDAFVVTYPPLFSMLFKEFNKPIILQIPIRYDWNVVEKPKELAIFHEFLKQDNVFCCANNMLDKMYFEDRVGKTCEYIPSLCRYTGMKYNPTRTDFLVYDNARMFDISNTVNRSTLQRHKWSDIEKFKGVIHVPYNTSTMSIFEAYQAGIPLFVPDRYLLLEWFDRHFMVLHQCFWSSNQHGRFGFQTMWNALEYADYYSEEFPSIITFSSVADLEAKMNDSGMIAAVAARMKTDVERLNKKVVAAWKNKIASL